MKLTPYTKWTALKAVSVFCLLAWAVTATALAWMRKSEVVLVGLDQEGARVISQTDDPLLMREPANLIRDYIYYSMNYTPETYLDAATRAANLLSERAWSEKESSFKHIAEELKKTPIAQEARILDIREFGSGKYEADVEVTVRSRLRQAKVKLRLSIVLKAKHRTQDNPYRFEIDSLKDAEVSNG